MSSAGIIRAGTLEQLEHPEGDWAFVDMGFAKSPNKTCGYLSTSMKGRDEEPKVEVLTYGMVTAQLKGLVQLQGERPLYLMLEAPLSAAFDASGNPIGRTIERSGAATRYWYVGLGCSVLVASLYLLKNLVGAGLNREVRLFEAFASFKDPKQKSDHRGDIEAMWAVLRKLPGARGCFSEPKALDSSCPVVSVLDLLGLDPTPPPILTVDLQRVASANSSPSWRT